MQSIITTNHPFFKLLNVNNIKEVIRDDIRITRLLIGNRVHSKGLVDNKKEEIKNSDYQVDQFTSTECINYPVSFKIQYTAKKVNSGSKNFFNKRTLFEKYLNIESRRNKDHALKSLSKIRTKEDYSGRNNSFLNQENFQKIPVNNYLFNNKIKSKNISTTQITSRNSGKIRKPKIKQNYQNYNFSEDLSFGRYDKGVTSHKNCDRLNQTINGINNSKNFYSLDEKINNLNYSKKKRRNLQIIENQYEHRKEILINSFKHQKKFNHHKIHPTIKRFISNFIFNMNN